MLWGASQRRGRSVRGRRAVFQPRQPMVMMALAAVTALLQCVGVSAQCATVPSDGLSICSMWNGRPMYEGISSSAEQLASLDQRAKAMISEIAGGEDDEDDDDQRPFCGSKGPACCDALVDLVCRSLPMHLVVEMQLDNAETPTVSEADALACSASALSVPTFSNCTTAVSDTCSVNVVRLRPTATPQPSPSPLPPNVVGAVRPAIVFNEPVSGMRMPLGPFCAFLTDSPKPDGWNAMLPQPLIEEERCDLATYLKELRLADLNGLYASEDACREAIVNLRRGRRFGPPSGYQVFTVVCTSSACLNYNREWNAIRVPTDCRCADFTLNRCPHLDPNELLCKWSELCYDSDVYQERFCAPEACGRAATNEDDWRKCGALQNASPAHVAVAVAAAVALSAWLARNGVM